MAVENKSCILVVDMINDFVTGKFGNQNAIDAVKIAENTYIQAHHHTGNIKHNAHWCNNCRRIF